MSEIHHLPIVDARRDSSPEAASLGDADLLQVGDLARKCDKTVRAIHHYENLGLLKPYKRSKGRYRLYAPDAVARVRWIGKLTDLGMTLAEIVSIVSSWERAGSAPEAMAEVDQVFRRNKCAPLFPVSVNPYWSAGQCLAHKGGQHHTC